MNYKILILQRAQKQLGQLPLDVYNRVKSKIISLTEDPRPMGCLKLTGRNGWRIRIGDYRVIYEINDEGKSITILDIGHRKNIYL